MPRSVLISLPQGLGVSGVATWATRLARALAARGWRVGVATHGVPGGFGRVDLPLDGARLFDMTDLPSFAEAGHDLGPLAPRYREALDELGASPSSPAILIPNLDSGAFALAAALAATDADRLRVIGWQHSDTRFDTAVMRTYEPMLGRIVGVSRHIERDLARELPWRRDEIVHLPYGVEIRDRPVCRVDKHPLRVVYTGRMEHEQKRVGVLCELARELERRDAPTEVELIGDGPAAAEVDDRLRPLPNARRVGPIGPDALRARLDGADVFVLASRYEGFSVSMLEAMGRGLAPIVTRVESGAAEAIDHDRSGILIEAGLDEPEGEIGARFADHVERLSRDRSALSSLRRSALERARGYSIESHADQAERLFGAALGEAPRFWPLSRPCAFVGSAGHGPPSGSVPPDAGTRARRTLGAMPSGARVAVYGAGRFTRAIAEVLADARVDIECVADDNPALWDQRLWGWSIIDPGGLAARGVTDVLVASWMHADIMAERARAVVPRGVRVHTLYGSGTCTSTGPET